MLRDGQPPPMHRAGNPREAGALPEPRTMHLSSRILSGLLLLSSIVACGNGAQRVAPVAPMGLPPVHIDTDFPPYGQVHANPYLSGVSGVDVKIDQPSLAKPFELPRPTKWQKAWRPGSSALP